MKLFRITIGLFLFFSCNVFAQVVLNSKAEKALSEIMKAFKQFKNNSSKNRSKLR
jgi:hypothetical protein